MINDYTPQKLIAKLIFSTLVCSSPLTNCSSVKDRGHFDENLFHLKKRSQFVIVFCIAIFRELDYIIVGCNLKIIYEEIFFC